MPAMIAVSLLTAVFLPHALRAEEAPFASTPSLEQSAAQSAAQSEVAKTPLGNRHAWELDAALFKSLSSENANQLGTARFSAKRFFTDLLSMSADVRYWPGVSYPLSNDVNSGTWAVGGGGQLYLFRNNSVGCYVGTSLLWVPSPGQLAITPEVGFKWFASQRFAIGASYWLMTDISSYSTSFAPESTGKSHQALGLELSVYL